MRPLLLALPLAAAACTVHGSASCPTGGPSPRAYASAVLDAGRNEIYLYGGITASGNSDELWRYSQGACSGWSQLAPKGTSPGGWARYGAAFDSKRDRIIYIGGDANDSWSLDVDHLVWTQLQVTGSPPAPSQQQWAVYDSDNDRVIFGGVQVDSLNFADSDQGEWQSQIIFTPGLGSAAAIDPTRDEVFAWNGLQLTAYSLTSSTGFAVQASGDQASGLADGLAWDAQQKRLLGLADGDVYAINATDAAGSFATIARLAPSGPAPVARSGAAFTVSGDLAFVFGGRTAAGCFLDDWWYLNNEATWEARSMATSCP